MRSLANISTAEFRQCLARLGLSRVRTKGGHEAWQREGMTRLVVGSATAISISRPSSRRFASMWWSRIRCVICLRRLMSTPACGENSAGKIFIPDPARMVTTWPFTFFLAVSSISPKPKLSVFADILISTFIIKAIFLWL